MPGRGAWLHADAQCLTQALNRKSFARAFKAKRALCTDVLEQQVSEMLSGTSPAVTPIDERHRAVHEKK